MTIAEFKKASGMARARFIATASPADVQPIVLLCASQIGHEPTEDEILKWIFTARFSEVV